MKSPCCWRMTLCSCLGGRAPRLRVWLRLWLLRRNARASKLLTTPKLIHLHTRSAAALSPSRNAVSQVHHSSPIPPTLTTVANMPATTAETLSLVTRNVSVAPLVLLSVADHYGRWAKGTRKRVVGVLLGQNDGKNVRVSNSFAGMHYPVSTPST